MTAPYVEQRSVTWANQNPVSPGKLIVPSHPQLPPPNSPLPRPVGPFVLPFLLFFFFLLIFLFLLLFPRLFLFLFLLCPLPPLGQNFGRLLWRERRRQRVHAWEGAGRPRLTGGWRLWGWGSGAGVHHHLHLGDVHNVGFLGAVRVNVSITQTI